MRFLPLQSVRDLLHRWGYGIAPYPLARLLRMPPPDLALDVGANLGQFAQELRRLGYRGRLVSFEPIPGAFRTLTAAAASDPLWDVRNIAVGAADGEATMNVASNVASSSILAPNAALAGAAPHLSFEQSALVPVRRLDGLADLPPGERVFLKVDTQGFEQAVLEGAEGMLDRIYAIQLELSFLPLYEGEPPAEEVMAWLRARGFVPAWLYPAFWAPGTRQWYQADILFLRTGGPDAHV